MTLADIIKHIESSGDPNAMRFEPGCYSALQEGNGHLYALQPDQILTTIGRVNHCSPATAEMIFSTSWGLYQDMGFELYGELCVDNPPTILAWLSSEMMQDAAVAKWCATHGFNAAGPLPDDSECARFARLYNGPGAVADYVTKMKAAAA